MIVLFLLIVIATLAMASIVVGVVERIHNYTNLYTSSPHYSAALAGTCLQTRKPEEMHHSFCSGILNRCSLCFRYASADQFYIHKYTTTCHLSHPTLTHKTWTKKKIFWWQTFQLIIHLSSAGSALNNSQTPTGIDDCLYIVLNSSKLLEFHHPGELQDCEGLLFYWLSVSQSYHSYPTSQPLNTNTDLMLNYSKQ